VARGSTAGWAGIGVLQDQGFGPASGEGFDTEGHAAQVVEGVVVVEQAVEVAGAAVVAAADAGEGKVEGGMGGFAAGVETVGVAHAVEVNTAQFAHALSRRRSARPGD
jgi:hypothetical protein